MPVKIRLSRHGKKKYPVYHIVVADSRAPRDGRFIERIGLYNSNTNPATIDLDFDKALTWLMNGALPTDTCRMILSSKGVMMKKHLLGGIRKGAITEEVANLRFNEWLEKRESKTALVREKLAQKKEKERSKRLTDEIKKRELYAEKVAKKLAQAAAKKAEESAENAESTEGVTN